MCVSMTAQCKSCLRKPWLINAGKAPFREVLSFSAAAPARAVDALGGDWYFGLGNLKAPTPDDCTPADTATGTLLALSPL